MYVVIPNFLLIVIFFSYATQHRAVSADSEGSVRVRAATLVKTCRCRKCTSMRIKIHTYTHTRVYTCAVCFKQRFGAFQDRRARDHRFPLSQRYPSHTYQPRTCLLNPLFSIIRPFRSDCDIIFGSVKFLTNINM